VFFPVDRAQFVQCAENLIRQGHNDVFYSFRQLLYIDVLWDLGALGALSAQRQANHGNCAYL
jgi:hypothetical protein